VPSQLQLFDPISTPAEDHDMTLASSGQGAPCAPAVLRYPGSKWTLAETIVSQFQSHFHYVEPFFGSGAVFFSKAPAPHEVLNDTNASVVNLFRALETTPWSRDEYDGSDEQTGDAVEDARRFVVRCWQAHASDLAKKTGWKNRGVHQRAGGMSHRWQKVPDQLRSLAWRLSDAEIENRPALDVIRRHSSSECLIYADPPYLHSTRTQHMYGSEMSDQDHRMLLESLLAHPGPVVVSGYANQMYDDALAGWGRVMTKAPKTEKGSLRVEVLWVKPDARLR
jgi:DNA adenine methylase